MGNLEDTAWWGYAEQAMRELIKQSHDMIEQETLRQTQGHRYNDYSFIVFPAAKAYEGFLKKLFLDMKLITSAQYYGEHFRIGRALSPTLPKRYRSGWVFGKLKGGCGGEELPTKMWETWKKGRNRVFHYFPNYHEALNLDQAKAIVLDIEDMMDECLVGCKIG
jgi:hypothetical protein